MYVDGRWMDVSMTLGFSLCSGTPAPATMQEGSGDVAAGTAAELNDQPVEGRVAVNAGDRLCADGVEARFITVEA